MATSKPKTVNQIARIAEHKSLATLAAYAQTTESLEITRPTSTNCPDHGNDINMVGSVSEVKSFVVKITGVPINDLEYLDKSAIDGKIRVRMDLKSGGVISGDVITKSAADTSKNADCQVNFLVTANENVLVTPDASKKLDSFSKIFRQHNIYFGVISDKDFDRLEKP